MASIELVIKIPEKMYHMINAGFYDYGDMNVIIQNGTLLPKGYGKLVDVGQCDRELFYKQCGGADALITVKSAFDMLMSLPPIIEAESEE